MIYIVFLEAVPGNKSIRISVAITSSEEELSISARVENDAQSTTSLSAIRQLYPPTDVHLTSFSKSKTDCQDKQRQDEIWSSACQLHCLYLPQAVR